MAHYLGQWIRCTDWWPDWQLRLYDRRVGQWDRVRVHESVRLNGEQDGAKSVDDLIGAVGLLGDFRVEPNE